MLSRTTPSPLIAKPLQRILFNPVWCAFICSLLLSSVAIYYTELPNRDGMLYIETAAIFLEEGIAAARENFDWVFFPVCIALVAKITGLGLEVAAYVLNSLLFAGACATMVRIAQTQFQSIAWYTCLVVLSLPAFNEQRNEIIREVGWWLLCLQALLAALRWQRRPGFSNALLPQLLLAVACLFRIEGAVFFGALAIWPLFMRYSWQQRLKHSLSLSILPVTGCALLLAAFASGQPDLGSRIVDYSTAANPFASLNKFNIVAEQFGTSILSHYSTDEAKSILFFGLAATVIKKFITNNGVLIVPFAFFLYSQRLRCHFRSWQPQAQFFLIYTFVLLAFVMHNLFMSSRYVIFLNILTIPLVAIGMQRIFELWPRWRVTFIICLVLAALANVVSLSPKKTQFREAGQWLKSHPELASGTYIEDPRTRYFAGPTFNRPKKPLLSPKEISNAIVQGEINHLVIYLPHRDTEKTEWLDSLDLEEISRFSNKSGDAVVVLQRGESR